MASMLSIETHTIVFDCILTEDRGIHHRQYTRINRYWRCISKHRKYLLTCTMEISLMIAAISAFNWICTYIYRAHLSFSTRYFDNNNLLIINSLNRHHLICKDIEAYLLLIIDDIPEITNKLIGIRNARYMQLMFLVFFNTQHNKSTIGVSKRRIGFPNAMRESISRFLYF